ncbi:hypothetical protein phytr_12150 [Candidatus Phycorickettsia trachydisci]|uniref:Uncharacterized protein n=1 Tax=Candidatus Phycorickettsia trachydisci TaxID=2115978 RepID=A0A2P1PA52_9RICK|nr:hypothetical protein [Candidatus Phycorickettsia trachydisci]AVP88140.1 hypothetical protein phytr_12150 [Candidatus Phycorickettsia trachydisci]
MMIRVVLILLLFFESNALAVNKAQLIADIQYLLSAETTIDYEDPKLKKILSKYNYRLFRTYKAFIEFDKSNKTKADLLKAKKALGILSYRPKNSYWQTSINETNIVLRFFDLLSSFYIANDMLSVLPEEKKGWDENYQYKYFKIPLWLALKYPDNLRIANGPGKLIVNAKKSVRHIEEFNEFFSMVGDVHCGFWTNEFGEQRFDSYQMTKHFIDIISFNPGIYFKYKSSEDPCLNQSIEERFSVFVKWAHKNEKNVIMYNKILLYFDKASDAIADYYKNNYNLGQYAPQARDILSHYVCDKVHYLKDIED